MSTKPNAKPTMVSIDRIRELMATEFNVELTPTPQPSAATANLNDRHVTIAALGTTAIIRAEADTEVATEDADATWYLAANQLNGLPLVAGVSIVDRTPTLIIRAEAEISIGAGMTDKQLRDALQASLDSVFQVHDGVGVVAEQLRAKAREEYEE